MYLNPRGPGYCRLVGSLGRNMQPLNTNQWLMDYSGDYSFDGHYPFGCNPVLISDPVRISDFLGLAELEGERSTEVDLLRLEKPSRSLWSWDEDWRRYGSPLNLVNQLQPGRYNLEFPRENEVNHLHFSGDIRDSDVPLFDFHTGSREAIWYNLPKFDVLDSNVYREFQATGLNDEGFLTFIYRDQSGDPVGSNHVPHIDYWDYVHQACDTIEAYGGELSGVHNFGFWPSRVAWPDHNWLYTIFDVSNHSVKRNNWWHFDIRYKWETKYQEGSNKWNNVFDVHLNLYCWFAPVRGINNPFDWNRLDNEVFQVMDHTTCSMHESDLWYFGNHYTRYPIDTTFPPVPPDTAVESFDRTYNVRPFSHPLQADSGQNSRLASFRKQVLRDGLHDINRYHREVAYRIGIFQSDFRASSFNSSSDGLHKSIDVLKANHIENATQLKSMVDLLPDVKGLSNLIAKAMKRDATALLDAVDILADAVLAFRFGQKPTADDVLEIAHTDIVKEINDIIQRESKTIYGQFHYSFTDDDMALIGLPGSLSLVTRSKIRIHTDLTSLLSTTMTANSMGLMPTLSRLWDLVPFSFVVDWFANIGGRLGLIDDQLLWMSMGIDWCLHSFKWSYYPPPDVLDQYGLTSVGSNPFALTGYTREFSRLIPRLRESKFDYLAPPHGPNLITVGALVWQFL